MVIILNMLKSPVVGRQVASYRTLPLRKAMKSSYPINVAPAVTSPSNKSSSCLIGISKRSAIQKTQKVESPTSKNIQKNVMQRSKRVHKPVTQRPEVSEEHIPKKPSQKIKKLISQSLVKQQYEKELLIKRAQDEEKENLEKKKQLKKANEHIRKRNAKQKPKTKTQLHKTAWGVDQRPLEHNQDNKKLRAKVRAERQKMHKKGRARIGLEAYKHLKAKKNASQIIIEHNKSIKEQDPDVLKFMKLKKKQTKIVQMTGMLENMLKENEREKALYDLYCKTKKKNTKKQDGLEYIDEALKAKRDKLKKRQENFKSKKMGQIPAALIIQRWWRKIRTIKIELNTPKDTAEEEKLEDFTVSIPEIPTSNIVEHFKKILRTEEVHLNNASLVSNDASHHGTSSELSLLEEGSPESIRDPSQVFFENPQNSPRILEEQEPGLYTVDTVFDVELTNFLQSISFKYVEKEVDPSLDYIHKFMNMLLDLLLNRENEILDVINTPLYPDILQKLYDLHNTNIGELCKVRNFSQILEHSELHKLKPQLNPKKHMSRNAYIEMLYGCVNEALNYVRPYDTMGVPPPWSKTTLRHLGENSLKRIFQTVLASLQSWQSARAGNIMFRQQNQAHTVNQVLWDGIVDNESQWTKYDDEEMQVVIDITDLILDYLLQDILNIFNSS